MLQQGFININIITPCTVIAALLIGGPAVASHVDDGALAKPPATEPTTEQAGEHDDPRNASSEQREEDEKVHDDSSPPSLDDLLGIEEDDADDRADDAAHRDHQEELDRRLSEERIADAFSEAIAKMSLSAEMLDERFDTGLGTQRVQEEIIAKLQQLIDEAQRQSSSSSSSSGSSASGQPQQDPGQQGDEPGESSPGDGEDGDGDQEAELPPGQQPEVNTMLEETREEWGALPDRVRDMLMQGRQERFSGLYEQLTREYYRRLAED